MRMDVDAWVRIISVAVHCRLINSTVVHLLTTAHVALRGRSAASFVLACSNSEL